MCNPVTTHRPDALLAKGEHAGLEWEVTKNGFGYRCGYIRVPAGHPWHGKDYDDVDVEVHGGLTFAAPDSDCGKGGEDNAWWLGFDCGHAGDAKDYDLLDGTAREYTEQVERMYPMPFGYETVKTTEYVTAECQRLAEQAAAAGSLDACTTHATHAN